MSVSYVRALTLAIIMSAYGLACSAEIVTTEQAQAAFDRGVQFFAERVASHGGYVYLYSSDLAKREGEGKTSPDTLWVQPPGTPAVGEAFVIAYERTDDVACLKAAQAAAECLLQGQYRSGGWNASIEFDSAERAKNAFRTDAPLPKKRQRNISSFDDDKTQSALRFLMRLDRALKFEDQRIHEATLFALESALNAQFPNGAWAQVWDGPADATQSATLKASYPADWPRKYPGGDYWWHYTFNDHNISNTIETLWLAEEIYGGGHYDAVALKAGNFMVLSQMPDPQPAWAQQYNFQMQPAWARKFEPPAITGSESQSILKTLMDFYVRTGDKKFLEPIPRALDYLQRSELSDGQLARFYELRTNKPLYLTRTYELTYDDGDLPTHYGFKVTSKVQSLRQRYDKLVKMTTKELERQRMAVAKPVDRSKLESQVAKIIAQQDDRGAWVESGTLKYHGKSDDTRQVISSETFIKHLDVLSQFLAAE